jgi:hypothetical protein
MKKNFFTSYAHDDETLQRKFHKLLEPRLEIAGGIDFESTIDHQLVLGDGWHDQLQQMIAISDFGMLLISPSFLASTYIADHELSHYINSASGQTIVLKPVVPIMLKPVPLDGTANLRGLDAIQIFTDRKGRSFSQCTGADRDSFVDQLVGKLLAKLKTTTP